MSTPSISVAYITSSNFIPTILPSQRFNVLDTTNPKYLRYFSLQNDSIILSVYTASIAVPLYGTGSLASAIVAFNPIFTWPPLIITQPTSSTVTHPAPVYFSVSASAELPVTYQWYYQSGSATWYSIVSTGSYTGSQTPALTSSVTSLAVQNTSSYVCVMTDASGQTTSSIVNLFVQ